MLPLSVKTEMNRQLPTSIALALYIVLVLFGAIGLTKLTIGSDTRVLFSETHRHMVNFVEFERRFAPGNYAVMALEANRSFLEPDLLAAINAITEQAWTLSGVRKVESLSNHQFVYGDDEGLELLEIGESGQHITEAYGRHLREIIGEEPTLWDRLISRDEKSVLIVASFTLDRESSDDVRLLMVALNQLVKETEQAYGIKGYIAGDIASLATYREAALTDALTLIPAGLCVALLLVVLVLGDKRHLYPLVANLIGGTIVTVGISGWLGEPINPVTIVTPLILFSLVTASSLHIFICFQRNAHKDAAAAAEHTIRNTYPPVIAANIFTVLGFFSLLFSSASPPIRTLGIMAIGGVLTTVVGYLSIYVVYLSRNRRYSESKLVSALTTLVPEAVATLLPYKKSTSLFILLLVATSLYGATRLHFNEAFMRFFDTRYEFRIANDFVEASHGGGQIFDYTIFAPEGKSILDPEYLATLEEFQSWLNTQDNVSYSSSIVQIVRRISSALSGVNSDYQDYALPSSREEIAQYVLLYEMSLPLGQDLSSVMNQNKTASRFSFAVKNVTSQDIRYLSDDIQKWFSQNAPDYKLDLGTGMGMMFAYLATDIARDVFLGLLVSITLITAIVYVFLRSILLTTFVFMANVLPVVIVFGIWGLIDGSVGMAASIVIALVVGVAIDDSIVFIWALSKATKNPEMSSPTHAVLAAVEEVGPAIITSSIALSIGFGLMVLSGFQVTKELGSLSAVIVLVACFFDLFVLPVIFAAVPSIKNKT
jgi:predicted RND superfamily exporter protein